LKQQQNTTYARGYLLLAVYCAIWFSCWSRACFTNQSTRRTIVLLDTFNL